MHVLCTTYLNRATYNRFVAMCNSFSHKKSPRYGSRLEHGEAHAHDHQSWSRRDFLTSLGLATGGAFLLGQTPVHAFAQSPMLAPLGQLESDRVLVLIQLFGGNDGLNTIIPVENDLYYRARPTLAMPKHLATSFTSDLYMHPSMAPLKSMYQEGQMALVQNVGYPAPDLSHFRSTDIWLTGSDADSYLTTGWMGRYLQETHPNFEDEPPAFPLAVQIGGLASMLFQGNGRNMGMSLTSPEVFERLAEEGSLYDAQAVPDAAYGREISFMRTVANDSFRYAQAIQDASNVGANSTEYPSNELGENLAVVARLIKGNLGARIYHVSLGGFDTHAEQRNAQSVREGAHADLLRFLAESVTAFQEDLNAEGYDERVLTMTFSEFGRRVEENGSQGTDHGTAAPLFVFGPSVNGGVFGSTPVLDDLDEAGNMKFDLDFRSLYATVLQDWFGFEAETAEEVLGHSFEKLDLVKSPVSPTSVATADVPRDFVLQQNYPNPFNPSTVIGYTLARPAHIQLQVYDIRGRLLQTLVDGMQPAGHHEAVFEVRQMPSGPYLYRLTSPEGTQTRKMLLMR